MRLLSRASAITLAAVLLVVVAHTVLSPLYGPFRWDTSSSLVVLAALALALVPLTLVLARSAPALEARPWLRRALVLVVLGVVLYVQLQVGWAIRVSPGWDASMVAGIGERLALGLPDDPGQQLYAAAYPNNALIVALLHTWYALSIATGHLDLWSAGVTLVALAMTSAVALAYLTARRLGGPVAAYLTLGFSLVFVALSPWSAVAYSDTLTMPFPVAVLYLFSLERGSSRTPVRAALWAAMGEVTVVGHSLKPTAVFALAAAVVVALVIGARVGRPAWRTLVTCVVATAVGVVAAGVLVGQVVAARGMEPAVGDAEYRLNVTHFLKMGAQHSPATYNDSFGADLEEDVLETRALPLEDRTRANLERYGERVGAMGPVGYARFLERKAVWTLGDGSFFAWGEGGMAADPTPWLVTDPRSAAVQAWFGIHGEHYSLTFSLWQGTWLLVLLLVAGGALRRRDAEADAVATTARLSLLMLVAFLLLFEARSRYLYLYLPYFLVLASLTLGALAPRAAALVSARAARGR
jgi:hypothetical protein